MSFEVDGIVYLEDDTNKICVVKHTTINTEVINIPAVVNGYTVVGIYDNAFSFNSDVKEIILPDTIRKIGAYAFTSCFHLERVEIEFSNVSITGKLDTLVVGEKAFLCCYSLEGVNFLYKRLIINNQSFDGCMSLIELVGLIISAKTDSFINCDKLISLVFAHAATVDFLVFNNVPSLKHLYFEGDAIITKEVSQELTARNVAIHCLEASNIMDLSYLGCNVTIGN